LLLGFRGLGLLRGWPFEDPDRAADEIAAIGRISARRDEYSEFEVEALDAGEAFTEWSATYDPAVNTLIAAEEPAVRAVLEEIVPGKALDLACGTGRLSRILRDLGNEVVASDGSPAMLRRARGDRAAEAFVCADLHRLPFPDASFDLAVCGLSLTHVMDLEPPIAEIARIVR
jgi:ubiquinone/menaquinone biosynthesis C-methylase UbiE